MDTPLNTLKPLNFKEWLSYNPRKSDGLNSGEYLAYLKLWYQTKTNQNKVTSNTLKQDYIQLLKDLNFLYSAETSDIFLKDIDYNNEEDLILAIPYFAKKLKQLAKVLNAKRESVKKAKSQHNLIGSNAGLEKLLRDYLLRSFTSQGGEAVQLPLANLLSHFPDLSSIKNNFFIEIEELHDPNVYHDSSPDLSTTDYFDGESLEDYFPLETEDETITIDDVLKVVATRFLPRAVDSPLLNVFKNYLTSLSENPDTTELLTQSIRDKILATQKYTGESIYGVSAIRIEDVVAPDQILQIDIQTGSNWFLWPSGFQVLSTNIFNNTYEPIKLTNSKLLNSGATAGETWKESDLIFSDKNGIVEGAWLQSTYKDTVTGFTEISLKSGEITQFLYPFVGFNLDSKTLKFKDHSLVYLSGSNLRTFNVLPAQRQQEILTDYYTKPLPSINVRAKYINNTSLVYHGAYAAKFSYQADQIIKRTHIYSTPISYADVTYEPTELAYLYKFNKTDIPVSAGENLIYWPVMPFDAEENVSILYSNQECLPVRLLDVNASEVMRGAVAGLEINSADVIYKLNSRSDLRSAPEAAWLGTDSLSALGVLDGDIPVYKIKPQKCADCIDGPVTTSLAFTVRGGKRVSFIWTGKDAYADDVFKYTEHAENCVYGKNYPHDYYSNQGYLNPLDENDSTYWTKCTCKSSLYSPIGHVGESCQEYNGMTDLLYADPFDLGDNFSFTKWKDTRNFSYKESPQFSYYQLDKFKGDHPVGYGTGNWKVSAYTAMGNQRMVLKTGRRYTYYRTSLRRDETSGSANLTNVVSPYLVINRPYEFPETRMCNGSETMDIVVVMDMSRSQYVNFDDLKYSAGQICVELTKNRQDTTQVAFIAFAKREMVVSYLTNDGYRIALQMGSLSVPKNYPDYQSDITLALQAAQTILLREGTYGYGSRRDLLKQLCRDTNLVINQLGDIKQGYNYPQVYATKKIIVISDGVITSDLTEPVLIDDTGNVVVDGTGKVVRTKLTPEQNLINLAEDIKNGIYRGDLPEGEISSPAQIISVNAGPLSITNNLMRQIASSEELFFDLYKFTEQGDGDLGGYISYISRIVSGCYPFRPTWLKAIKNDAGEWMGTTEPSDMILNPGDYLLYQHRTGVTYTNLSKGNSFFVESIPFTINIKLNGWDYVSNSFSSSNIGDEYGAKPFWAEIPSDSVALAGQITFVNEFVPVHQPPVSKMILKTGDYLEYTRNGLGNLNWSQPQTFVETVTSNNWKKITLKETFSNLTDFLRSGYRDVFINETTEPSDMLLESYSEYKPARYHYISKQNFVYEEPLYLRNKCKSNFTYFVSSLLLEPTEPHANLTNIFYPTIATVSFPQLMVSEQEVGGYLLPENLGVSSYRGKGYSYKIDENSLSAVDTSSLSAERVFIDLNKYGSRNRGLTKKDQISPIVLQSLNNNWVAAPYSAGDKAGVIINSKESQKFTPYQSSYEIDGVNYFGMARQQDQFQFWSFRDGNPYWNDPNTNISFNGQNQSQSFGARLGKLLVNKGTLTHWRTDLLGNDYGLYKFLSEEPIDKIIKADILPVGILSQTISRSFKIDTYSSLNVTVSGSKPCSFQWFKNSKPVYGGNQPSLIFNRIEFEDTGVYFCKITNAVSTVKSRNINIMVLP
jgi:hypothetical protein